MIELMICQECGNYLTDEERFYYEYRCEGCETAWHNRVEAWRKGSHDAELDELFSEPRRYTLQ